jgi:hypothetical protein
LLSVDFLGPRIGSRRAIQGGDQALRSYLAVPVRDYLCNLLPIECHVQKDAKPTPTSYIGGPEETIGLGCDGLLLRTFGGCAPKCNPVVVMMVGVSNEELLVAYEPRRLAVTLSLGRFGKR